MGFREIEWAEHKFPFGHVQFEVSLGPLIGVIEE